MRKYGPIRVLRRAQTRNLCYTARAHTDLGLAQKGFCRLKHHKQCFTRFYAFLREILAPRNSKTRNTSGLSLVQFPLLIIRKPTYQDYFGYTPDNQKGNFQPPRQNNFSPHGTRNVRGQDFVSCQPLLTCAPRNLVSCEWLHSSELRSILS